MWNRNLRIGLHRDGRLIVAACLATFLGFVAYVSRLSDVTHDAFHEMALVRAMFESGSFPLNDIFAFTPTVSPAVHHEWGTGLFLYMVAGANPMGLHGMAVARLLLIAADRLAWTQTLGSLMVRAVCRMAERACRICGRHSDARIARFGTLDCRNTRAW